MKSLEIINSEIKQMKKKLHQLGETEEGTAKDFIRYYITEELKNYQNVKQDLKVLEILKRYLKVKELELGIEDIIICVENEKDYNKVKQWLEEQEW